MVSTDLSYSQSLFRPFWKVHCKETFLWFCACAGLRDATSTVSEKQSWGLTFYTSLGQQAATGCSRFPYTPTLFSAAAAEFGRAGLSNTYTSPKAHVLSKALRFDYQWRNISILQLEDQNNGPKRESYRSNQNEWNSPILFWRDDWHFFRILSWILSFLNQTTTRGGENQIQMVSTDLSYSQSLFRPFWKVHCKETFLWFCACAGLRDATSTVSEKQSWGLTFYTSLGQQAATGCSRFPYTPTLFSAAAAEFGRAGLSNTYTSPKAHVLSKALRFDYQWRNISILQLEEQNNGPKRESYRSNQMKFLLFFS